MADWTTGQPAYQQVADALRAKIRNGDYAEGAQLPSYSDLMQTYDVSVTVARSAVAALRAEGLLATHQGKGAFVLPGAAGSAASRTTVLDDLRRELDELSKRVEQLEAERAP